MNENGQHGEPQKAASDLKSRTLSSIPGELAQMVYLASTRDYNTGQYYHDGLSFRFGEDAAESALATCHQEVFRSLAFTSLEELVHQLDSYFLATQGHRAELLETWKKLEPYRVTVPVGSDPLTVQLFLSNVKIALAILEARPVPAPAS